jgi:hypothetical protein
MSSILACGVSNMTTPAQEIERQIEAAFDYRGHVTITLKEGERIVGYVYNRQFAHPTLLEAPFIEVFLAGSGESRKFAIDVIHTIELTGKDYAATGSASQDMVAPDSSHPHDS